MSEAQIIDVLDRLRTSTEPVVAAARKYCVIAGVSSALWAVAVAVLSVFVPDAKLHEDRAWSDLLTWGLACIVVVCGSLTGMAVASARYARGLEAGVSGTSLGSDEGVLEIRGLSLVVGSQVGADAWNTLRDGKLLEYMPVAEAGSVSRRRDGRVPLSPLACAMQGVCDSIRCVSFVPLLVWPPDEDGVEPLDPVAAIAELGSPYSSLCFISVYPETQLGADVNEAIFSVFDQNPTLPMLLIVSADGPAYRLKTSSNVTSNASAMFVVKRDRIEKDIRPFAVERTTAEATYQPEPAIVLFWKATNEPRPGEAHGVQLKVDVWRSKIEPILAQSPEQDFPCRSIFVPVPWRLRDLRALDDAPRVGMLSRSLSVPVREVKPGLALSGRLRLGQQKSTDMPPDPNEVHRALVNEMPELHHAHQLMHDILNPVTSSQIGSSRAVLGTRPLTVDLGKGASLAAIAYAAQATKSSGGTTVVVHVTDETALVATVLPGD